MAKAPRETGTGLGAFLRPPFPIETVYLAAPVLVLAVAALVNTIKPFDYFWALAQGRVIAQTGANTSQNLFLYTLPADAPAFNHAWLAQLILYGVATRFGHAANMVLLAGALALAQVAILDTGLRLGVTARRLAVTALLSTPFLSIGAGVRTQLFAFPCFALAAWALLVPGWSQRRLLLLAAVTAAYANLHGSFVLLPAFATAVMLGRRDLSPRTRLATVLVVLLAACAHPSGPRAFAYALLQPGAMGVAAGSSVEEWRGLSLTTPLGVGFLVGLAALAVVTVRAWRRVRFDVVVLTAGLSVAAMLTMRFVPFVALLAPLVLPTTTPATMPATRRALGLLNAALLSLFALLVLACLPWGPVARVLQNRGLLPSQSFARDVPMRLAHSLAVLRPGRIFHTQAVGGLLEWTLCVHGPEPVAFVDQRFELLPISVWRDYADVCGARDGFAQILRRYGVVAVLAEPREAKPLLDALANDPGWSLTDQEGEFRLYLRK
jgi:hypothetical protein